MAARALVFVVLLAVAAVPLAQAQDRGTTPAPTMLSGTSSTTEPAATTTTTDTASTATTRTTPTPGVVPDGVTIEGVVVGGLTATEAALAVQAVFEQPLQFAYEKRRWWASPDRFGAKAYIAGAVQRALTSAPGTIVDLVVTVRRQALDRYVALLNRNFGRPARGAALRLVNLRPRLSKSRAGFDIEEATMKAAIVRALENGERGPLTLDGSALRPKVSENTFGLIIVIRRESKSLYLYDGEQLVRRFGVATGQPSYPTPLGRYEIINKQKDPWWYPPPDSAWAQGAEAIPPGPGNPLGTRWMGISAPLIGIHGTPDAASIGYSASHGCIRMLVSEAEWLFERVELGTPVFIVPA